MTLTLPYPPGIVRPDDIAEKKVEDRARLGHSRGKGISPLLPQEAVRVVPGRQFHHTGRQPSLQEEFHGAERRLFTGAVRIEQRVDLASIPLQEFQVAAGQGRAAGGHGIPHAGLVEGQVVEIPFDDNRRSLLAHRLLGKIDPEQELALMIDG